MAHHKSAKKRIITSRKAKFRNHVIKKSIRTVTKKLFKIENKEEAVTIANKLYSMLDQAGKKGVLHKNKVNRHKSQVAGHVNKLSA